MPVWPRYAAWCRRWRLRGWLKTRPILAHGTEEPPAFLAAFDCVQHLAPWHLEQAGTALAQYGDARPRPLWCAIPNFVDTEVFRPARSESKREASRAKLGLPAGGLLVGCAAVVKPDHKRIDYLIREFAAFAATPAGRDAHLVIAGAHQPDSKGLVALARALTPDRVTFRFDLPRESMPDFYCALDVFTLTSLFEMMPIAVLEALASGIPACVNRHPVLEWIIGTFGAEPGGVAVDMSRDGALAAMLAGMYFYRIVERLRLSPPPVPRKVAASA